LALKRIAWLLVGVLVGALVASAASAGAGTLHGTYMGFPIAKVVTNWNGEVGLNVPSIIVNGRVMVPLRLAAEIFDRNIAWDQASYTVRASWGNYYLEDPIVVGTPEFEKKIAEAVNLMREKGPEFYEHYQRWVLLVVESPGKTRTCAYQKALVLGPGWVEVDLASLAAALVRMSAISEYHSDHGLEGEDLTDKAIQWENAFREKVGLPTFAY
jgi:hypothetical protein